MSFLHAMYRHWFPRAELVAVVLAIATLFDASSTQGQINNIQTGQPIPGTAGITLGPGLDLSGWNSLGHNLQYGDFSNNGAGGLDLTGTNFNASWLDNSSFFDATAINASLVGTSLTGANLQDANFSGGNVSGADLTGALIAGAWFANTGLTAQQIYSTASYAAKNLDGVEFGGLNLASANLSSQSLQFANFYGGNLSQANFAGAALHGSVLQTANLTATNFQDADLRGALTSGTSDAITTNAILPLTPQLPDSDLGIISPLALGAHETLVVRDFQQTFGSLVYVDQAMTLNATSTLERVLLSPTGPNSVMILNPGVSPSLAGTLDLQFAPGLDPAIFVGQQFQLFQWNGQLAPGQHFDQIVTQPGVVLDTSHLYTDGYVTLTSVPEPSSCVLLLCGAAAMLGTARRTRRHSMIGEPRPGQKVPSW